MDSMRSWKKVLLQWITECGLMDRNYLNIEQSDIDLFYKNFCIQHPITSTNKFKHLSDFLKEFYPEFEPHFDDENCLSAADYVYVYSILLHFCCVKQPERVFHEICNCLPDGAQHSIADFFEELLKTDPITKESIRHAIAEVGSTQVTPPRLNDSSSSGATSVSIGGLSSSSIPRCESPLKTPRRNAGQQRISPSTPKSYLLEERTRELYNLRAQLETDRYEKGLLELQIKQNEDEIQKINNDRKRLLQQIQELKNDLLLSASDVCGKNCDGEENQVQRQIFKDLSEKEQDIIKLSENVRTLSEEKALVEKKLSSAEKQMIIGVNRIKELDYKVDELSDQLNQKNDYIKYLTDTKQELEKFISETRSSCTGVRPDLNASGDCLDNSFLRSANVSNSFSSPENLGVSVVDVQLREKEHENQQLKEILRNIQHEHKRLAKHLTKLTQDFEVPTDGLSTASSENSESDTEHNLYEDGAFHETEMSCEEQFKFFSGCMEKIYQFHKNEKNKVKQLEHQSNSVRVENEELTRKLSELMQEVEELKKTVTAKERLQLELNQFREMLEETQNNLLDCEKIKNKFHNEVKSLESEKEKLQESKEQLKSKLELQHREIKELSADNKKLSENEQALRTQLQELQNELCDMTLQWDEKFKHLYEINSKQSEEINAYKETEQTIKRNYEQAVVKNEELKKEARQANTYLSEISNALKQKENQLTSLGQEIEDFKQKNAVLEQNVNCLMEEHKREMLTSSSAQRELDKQLAKLKEQLIKTELLMDSKRHECELKQQCLSDAGIKMSKILKLFNDSNESDDEMDIVRGIEELVPHIENMLEQDENMKNKLLKLQEIHEKDLAEIQNLTKELREKSHDFKKNQEELSRSKEDSLEYKKKIEELQQQQVCILEKAKRDLLEKEKELEDRLTETLSEHEAFMERITVELKLERQNHSDKEMELILSKAECNDAKKKLNEAKEEVQKLRNNIKQLQQNCERLKQFETRVVECSEENDKLRNEIETFKQQVTQNVTKIVEAEKVLMEFMELTKEQNITKSEVNILQNKMKEKDDNLMELERKLQQQNELTTSLQELVEKLGRDKKRLLKDAEENVEKIEREQQDKLILLTSLEKSTDDLKLAEQQSASLEKKLQDLKEQCDSLVLENTRLQGDLVEREAELRLSLDEQQQEQEDFEQKLAEKSDKLVSMDNFLIEILAIMENNFNLELELLPNDIENVFNCQANKNETNLQKLRKHLNCILFKQQELNEQLQQLTSQKEEAVISLATLKDSNSDLLVKLNEQENTLRKTHEQLQNEELMVEKRVNKEIKRLEEDLSNLEKINERLTNENVKIQVTLGNIEEKCKDLKLKIKSQEEQILQLKGELRDKTVLIEKLLQDDKKTRQALKEKNQQIEKVMQKSKTLEDQLKDKTTRLQSLEKEYQEAKGKTLKNQQNQQAENRKLQEKLKLLQTSVDSLELDVGNKYKELLVEKHNNSELLQKQKDLEEQLSDTSIKLDEMLTNKLNAETRCEQLQSEVQQLKRDMDFTNAQRQIQQEDNNRLNQEIKSLKVDKQHLRDEVHENKLTLQRANDNVTQLIQQISSIRLEKEAVLEENLLLRKQLEETGKNQSSSETKMKSIMDKSQDLERKLLTAENELKSLKANLGKSENCAEKLQAENKKLRDSQDTSTKRIEKLALKLGDSQARSSKLERENEKLARTLEAHTVTVEALQKEKDLLQAEAKGLKERLSRAERGHEQLAAKVQNLEHLNTSLQQFKQKLEASEIDAKIKLNKLEKMRENSEEKIRKLTNSLNNAENVNVKLNLEIGALNSQLKEIKVEQNQERSIQIGELNSKLTESLELNHKYEEVNEKLKIELNTLKEDNSSLKDQLSKASISLQITCQKCESFAAEMEQIRADMLAIRQEKSEIEQQHNASIQKINQFELENTKMASESNNLVQSLEQKIGQLVEELAGKSKQIIDFQKEIELLKENTTCQNTLTQQNNAANLTELEDLRTKLSLAEDIRLKEEKIISELRSDNQILHKKYQETKQRVLDAAKSSEERIKENRLELEGKLDKMKNKMKTLYTEEITKMKTKQERETAIVKSEMEVLKAQNTKYEEHTRKLSNQIVRLNDNILQHQKENTILSTKLKHAIDQLRENECNRRPTSIHVSTVSSSTAPTAGHNLAMEDEEGEVFNNTYLTDLKNGNMPELMSRDIAVEELKYRNSLLPPHLRSTYAAQFDHELSEDDLKDGPHSMDDSMSALLSTTASGVRKKCTGVTHYKRPGPPTPSKNGGRLSFGGFEPPREILKESCDTNAGSSAASSAKTPARFNFFASRFSMGSTRDEKPYNEKQSDDEPNLQKVMQKTKIKLATATRRLLSGVGCTSTPRKSKGHYDQRRLLDQLIKSSPSPSPLTVNNKSMKKETKITPPDVSIIETPLTALVKCEKLPAPVHKNNTKHLEAIAVGLKRSRRYSSMFGRRLSRRMQEICTPTSGETTSSALSTPAMAKDKMKRQVVGSSSATTSGGISKTTLLQMRLRKRPKKEKGSRPSLCLRGSVFAKYRTPNRGVLHDLNHYKSRKQRRQYFDKGRNIKSFAAEMHEGETNKTINYKDIKKDFTYNLKHNNYNNDTVVVTKYHPNKQKLVEDTFTFGEEQFEHSDTDDSVHVQTFESEEDYDYDSGDVEPGAKYDFPAKQEFVTTQRLENFDRFIASIKSETENEKHNVEFSPQGSSEHFEKLLVDIDSNAPFDVENYNVSKCSRSTSSSNSQRSSFSNHSHSHPEQNSINLTTATPHHSPGSNPSCHLSRTFYGSTVIYNHRLPHINTTYVRKSSIYIKNRKRSSHQNLESSACNDVVLITDQTITVADLMRMWSQMDNSTRIIVSFAILASFTTLFSLFLSLYSRH